MYNINTMKNLLAQAPGPNPSGTAPGPVFSTQLSNPIGQSDIVSFITNVLNGIIKIGIPVVALAIIYCGFLFVAARGNSEKLTKAKEALFYTLIGAAILLGAMALAHLVSDTVTSL
jgi:hypothetical protein